MKINIDYKIKRTEGDKSPSNSELTLDYIAYAVTKAYPEGLESQSRRIWARLQAKIEEAIDTKVDDIVIEAAEKDFVLGAFEKCKYPPHICKYASILEKELEKLKEEKK